MRSTQLGQSRCQQHLTRSRCGHSAIPAVRPLPACGEPCGRPCGARQRLQRQQITCSAEGPDRGPASGFRLPFGGGGKKQDDARKQLQNLFKDKPDTLAAYDQQPPGGGKGGGKGGGGGGSGGGSGGDWREWGQKAWRRLRDSLKGMATALGAALLFASVLILVSFGPAAVGFVTGILRRVLRLGGSGRARPHVHTHAVEDDDPESLLGPWERRIIAKYGPQAQRPQEAATA